MQSRYFTPQSPLPHGPLEHTRSGHRSKAHGCGFLKETMHESALPHVMILTLCTCFFLSFFPSIHSQESRAELQQRVPAMPQGSDAFSVLLRAQEGDTGAAHQAPLQSSGGCRRHARSCSAQPSAVTLSVCHKATCPEDSGCCSCHLETLVDLLNCALFLRFATKTRGTCDFIVPL